MERYKNKYYMAKKNLCIVQVEIKQSKIRNNINNFICIK